MRRVAMRKLEGRCGPEVGHEVAGTNRKKPAAKSPGDDSERDVDNAIEDENPHGGEMPEQCPGKPVSKGYFARKAQEIEQWRGVVDLPARTDHHQNGERVDPMAHAQPNRMDCLFSARDYDRLGCHRIVISALGSH